MTLVRAESGATCEYRECGMTAVVCDLDTVSDGECSFYCAEHRPDRCRECGAPLPDYQLDRSDTCCLECRGPRWDTVAEREGLR